MNVRGVQLDGAWKPEEKHALEVALRPIPDAWLEHNEYLRVFVRSGTLQNAPANAPGHSMYDHGARSIVLFDKGVYHDGKIDPEQFRRSVYHELAHSLLRQNPALLERWRSATAGDRFVDQYAKSGPDEDFCDTFSEALLKPNATGDLAPRKAHFIAELLADAAGGKEKTAMFFDGFADELLKTAMPQLGPLAKKIGGIAAVGGAGALAGHHFGKKTGERQGVQEGAAMTGDIAQRAYRVGVQRGAAAMRNAMIDISKPGGKGHGER